MLLLDEPTAFLDLAHQVAAMEMARVAARGGLCVVAVLHDLNLAGGSADRIVVLSRRTGGRRRPAARGAHRRAGERGLGGAGVARGERRHRRAGGAPDHVPGTANLIIAASVRKVVPPKLCR